MGPNDYLDTLRPLAMRFGLERMDRALDALGRPDRDLAILHVAGTNGKGSTCAMAARALRLAGHRVGLYTSPHLVRFHERIQVDGRAHRRTTRWRRGSTEVRRACPWHEGGGEADRLTYFEFATLVGLLHLARERVDAAVVEVGLGGRFDATSAVTPRVVGGDPDRPRPHAVPGRAGRRHRPGEGRASSSAGCRPWWRAPSRPEAMEALRDEAARRGAPFHVGRRGLERPRRAARPAPAGQRGARRRGAPAPRRRRASGWGRRRSAAGIASARWPGRMEEVGGVLLDGAHNPDGAAALAAALPVLHPGRPVELVFGVLSDKDHEGMLAALAPAARRIHLVAPDSPRAREPGSYLRGGASARRPRGRPRVPSGGARLRAGRGAADGALVCVAGSLYLVGEARSLLAGERM